MAQSKKDLVKKIDRQCRRLDPRVKYLAAQFRRHDLVDTFGLIWGEAYSLLHEMQRFHSGDLKLRPADRWPVTYQQVAQLQERLQTFTRQLPSTR